MKTWCSALLMLFLGGLCGCEREPERVEVGQKGPVRISGKVRSVDGQPIQGVVALERGELYSKDYRWSGWVKDGAFTVEVPAEGDYGLHVYATGYIYHPVGIRVVADKDNSFEFTVPPIPAPDDAPSLSEIEFQSGEAKGEVLIRLQARDRNENLSHQVLGIHPEAGISRMFSPEGFIFPWTKNYPNGAYTLTYSPADEPFNREEWIFLAADNRCYTSPLLVHPFTPESVLASHVGNSREEKTEGQMRDLSPPEKGRRVFEDNCAVCHHPDSTETKIGPGLKGLFDQGLTPVEKVPVTEENIRNRIRTGGDKMPPYSHIQGDDLAHLLSYLKSL